MKILSYIITLSILSSCVIQSHVGDGIVRVIGVRDGTEVVRGMGVCMDDSTVLTSAHVVRDDTISYELRVMNYEGIPTDAKVTGRDTETDMAYMRVKSEEGRVKSICRANKEYIGKMNIRVGQSVFIPVIRSGSVITLTGTITSLTGTILAYDTLGRTELMTGVLMTDISLEPGDSGAPILDEKGRIVDVVHIQ